jgi:hypothetical protein
VRKRSKAIEKKNIYRNQDRRGLKQKEYRSRKEEEMKEE